VLLYDLRCSGSRAYMLMAGELLRREESKKEEHDNKIKELENRSHVA
jgi:hypothetical protein